MADRTRGEGVGGLFSRGSRLPPESLTGAVFGNAFPGPGQMSHDTQTYATRLPTKRFHRHFRTASRRHTHTHAHAREAFKCTHAHNQGGALEFEVVVLMRRE